MQRRIQLGQGYLDAMWMTWKQGIPCGPVTEDGEVGRNYLLTTVPERTLVRLDDELEYDDDWDQHDVYSAEALTEK